MNIYQKYYHFKEYTGMYVKNITYCEISNFLCGMNYIDNSFLFEFRDWINTKFNIKSPFYWVYLIETLYTGVYEYENLNEELLLKLKTQYKTDIDFLFALIDEFLENKEQSRSLVF